jgi:hypothetical protein
MISNSQNGNGTFSANVQLSLFVDNRQLDVASLGPGFAIFRNPHSIEASEGEIETIVDEKVTRWKVRFTSPITAESKRFTFEAV